MNEKAKETEEETKETKETRKQRQTKAQERRRQLAKEFFKVVMDVYEDRFVDVYKAEEKNSPEFKSMPDGFEKDHIINRKIRWDDLIKEASAKFKQRFKPQEVSVANEAIRIWYAHFSKVLLTRGFARQ